MSLIAPHIRVLRAEAAELNRVSGQCSADALAAESVDQKTIYLTVALTLGMTALAKTEAADRLQAEEDTVAAKLEPQPGDVKFNPKGKP